MSGLRIISCPACGLSLTVPANKALPDEGPMCQMGHEPTAMVTAVVAGIGRG